jgi:hypothetical protein
MLIRAWRFVTILLTALLMGMTFAHVLEMPAKMQYDPGLYLVLQRSLYVAFGWPYLGAFIELGAVLAAIVLVFLVRKEGLAGSLTLLGAVCLVAGLVVYFMFIEPANTAMRAMAIQAPPHDWDAWRRQWEYGHAVHFALHLMGFSALLLSALLAHSTVPTSVPPLPDNPAARNLPTKPWELEGRTLVAEETK